MKSSAAKNMLRSLLISYLLSFLLLFLLTFLCYQLKLAEKQITLTVYAVYLISCLTGGLYAGKKIHQKRFLWGMLLGILYFSILFLVSWLTAKDSFGNLNDILTVMTMCVASGTLGGMLS